MRARPEVLIRGVYALCLLVGTSTHLVTLVQHGPLYDYGGVNPLTRVFWNLLVAADPLAAVLLFARPRLGLMLTGGIIGLDVANNLAVYVHSLSRGPSPATAYPMFLGLQVAFLLFVAATIRIPWTLGPDRGRQIPSGHQDPSG